MSQLAQRWSRLHEVHLVTWSTPATDRYPLPATVQRHPLDLQQPSRNLLAAVAANYRRVHYLRRELRSIQPDFILSFCDQMNIVALEAARPLGLPLWIAEHSDPAKQRLSRLWEAWRRRTYPTCAGAVALTHPIAQTMEQWIPAEKLRVIPPAIHPPEQALAHLAGHDVSVSSSAGSSGEATEPLRDPARSLTFLYVGRLSPEKGVDILLEAWRRVWATLPTARLVLVGDGQQRASLEQQAGPLKNVEFRGWVDDPWLELFQADCFVLPSRYEGFPVALLEALQCGLACASTNCTSALDAIEQQGSHAVYANVSKTDEPEEARAPEATPTAFLRVAKENPAELAEAMLRLAADSRLRRDLGTAARRVAEYYHWTRIGPLWDAILSAQTEL
jgi:glycosyltransferase involved in cell wall biosynthesis